MPLTQVKVALLDPDTNRFPDDFTPQQVLDSEAAAAASATAAEGSATAADTARVGAETARDLAVTARTGAETALTTAQQLVQTASFLYVAGGNVSGSISLAAYTDRQPIIHYRLTGNLRITALPPTAGLPAGFTITLRLAQDATGGRALQVDNLPTSYAAALVLSTAANAVDVIHIVYLGNGMWLGVMAAQQVGIPTGWTV